MTGSFCSLTRADLPMLGFGARLTYLGMVEGYTIAIATATQHDVVFTEAETEIEEGNGSLQ